MYIEINILYGFVGEGKLNVQKGFDKYGGGGKRRSVMGLIYIYVIILIVVMCIFFELKVYDNYLVLVLEVYIY